MIDRPSILPPANILQIAYTVPDIEAAIRAHAERLKIGPWFVRGPFQSAKARYRGAPSSLSLTIAISFSGPLMLELIQQHDDAPSVYRETIGRQGHGFHHWGVACDSFDDQLAAYRALGHEPVFSDETPSGARVAYLDTTRELPGMIELIEMTDANRARYAKMQGIVASWDGHDPIRPV
jgi:hypothetical protein